MTSRAPNLLIDYCAFVFSLSSFPLVTSVLGEVPESVWFQMMILDKKEGRGKLRNLPGHKLPSSLTRAKQLSHQVWHRSNWIACVTHVWLLVSELTLSMLVLCLYFSLYEFHKEIVLKTVKVLLSPHCLQAGRSISCFTRFPSTYTISTAQSWE